MGEDGTVICFCNHWYQVEVSCFSCFVFVFPPLGTVQRAEFLKPSLGSWFLERGIFSSVSNYGFIMHFLIETLTFKICSWPFSDFPLKCSFKYYECFELEHLSYSWHLELFQCLESIFFELALGSLHVLMIFLKTQRFPFLLSTLSLNLLHKDFPFAVCFLLCPQ